MIKTLTRKDLALIIFSLILVLSGGNIIYYPIYQGYQLVTGTKLLPFQSLNRTLVLNRKIKDTNSDYAVQLKCIKLSKHSLTFSIDNLIAYGKDNHCLVKFKNIKGNTTYFSIEGTPANIYLTLSGFKECNVFYDLGDLNNTSNITVTVGVQSTAISEEVKNEGK